jgi:primosomal protein N' (replication factor Y)
MKAASAQVVIPGVEGQFSYLVPRELSSTVQRGTRVLVPFRSRRVTGFVVETHEKAVQEATRSLEQLLDDSPAFTEDLLDFAKWISDYYLCTWGDALRAALPAGLDAEDQFRFSLTEKHKDQLDLGSEGFSQEVAELLDALEEAPLSARQIQARFGIDPDGVEIKRLKQSGQIEYKPYLRGPRTGELVEKILELTSAARGGLADETLWTFITTRSAQRIVRELHDGPEEGVPRRHLMRGASKQRRQALEELLAKGFVRERKEVLSRWKPDELPQLAKESDSPLTLHQTLAIAAISAALDEQKYTGFLLHGVTGSGKTRVYIEAIKQALTAGRTALVLVPEISLTPVLWGRFRSVFGDLVAIQHSGQPMSVRYDIWRGIARGEYKVVIGARSAIFAPLPNLGLLVVDEEHDASYKQTEGVPRYSARDAGLFRAAQSGAVAILGSATPSLESLFAVEQKRLGLLSLPERATGATLPKVELIAPVDLEEEEGEKSEGENSTPKEDPHVLSDATYDAIEEVLSRGKQAIVLQNRRGFAPFLICRHCGKLFECPNCSVSLTYHRPGRILRCHYCHQRDDAPDLCPSCGAEDLHLCGSGTQRVAEELAQRFPEARIARMDSDAMAKMGSHGELMLAFARKEYDLLVGTQMIAKGLDFPDVELAVVADADTELFYPDFRASERGASLLLQLSGRAGRASTTGKVILQTRAHEHPAIYAATHAQWLEFATEELGHRQRGGFPPYSRVVMLRSIGTDESDVARAMLFCKRKLESQKHIELLGPSPCAVVKIRNRIRYQLLVRTSRVNDPTGAILRRMVSKLFEEHGNSEELRRVQWEIDVDPASTA